MRIGLDVMGGDRGPAEIVAGALEARELLDAEDCIVLVGDRGIIEKRLGGAKSCPCLEIQHSEQVIGMGEPPVEALRTKPKSSIVVMAVMQRRGELDACVSAGNTGAGVAAAQMHLRRLKGVHRPGIAVLAPTFHGPVALCDVGANVNCRPQHLHQYGLMTSVYMSAVCDMESPRVGLLSIGEEEGKGNDLVKKASELMKKDPCVNFIGNVEGHDLPRDIVDVMVCEGFVGNVVLKLTEGLGQGVTQGLIEQFKLIMPDQIDRVLQAAEKITMMYDFNQYGGAPLRGVNGIWIVSHGASTSVGIKHAIREAKQCLVRNVNQRITEQLSRR